MESSLLLSKQYGKLVLLPSLIRLDASGFQPKVSNELISLFFMSMMLFTLDDVVLNQVKPLAAAFVYVMTVIISFGFLAIVKYPSWVRLLSLYCFISVLTAIASLFLFKSTGAHFDHAATVFSQGFVIVVGVKEYFFGGKK